MNINQHTNTVYSHDAEPCPAGGKRLKERARKARGTNAVRFLKALFPHKDWVLTTIPADGGTTRTCTFGRNQRVEARRFIVAQNDERSGVYYSPPARTAVTKKPTKKEIARVNYLFVDADPDDNETSAEFKARMMPKIEAFRPKPSFVIDSGNGLQLLWRLDQPIELAPGDDEKIADIEARNHALAIRFGANPSTRNIDRLLRVPGTTNYPNAKKRERGRVECKAKWVNWNHAAYPLSVFPPHRDEPAASAATATGTTAAGEWTFPKQLLLSLHSADPGPYASRSELLFAFLHGAFDVAGVTDEAIVDACLRAAPNGCVAQHCREGGGEHYVHKQIAKARAKHPSKRGGQSDTRPLVARSVSEFQSKKLNWLWNPFIPLGMITMILGDGGVGKSTVALDILARITRGEAWPTLGDDEETYAPEGNVVVLTKEEDIGMIVKPRLAAAGADLDRVHTFGYEVPDDATEFDIIGRLDEKVREIERLILEIGHVRAILIDPITDFLGKRDINSAPEVRSLLTPLLQLAARHKIAVINIMHLNKKTDQAVRYRGMGSGDFRNVSKSTLFITKLQDGDGTRVMAMEKWNFTGSARAITFHTTQAPRSIMARISWGEEQKNVDLDDLLNGKIINKQMAASKFLRDQLADGPVLQSKLSELAKENGISTSTLRIAQRTLGIKSEKEQRANGQWMWRLPT